MVRLALSNLTAYPWFTNQQGYCFRGYFFADGTLYNGHEALLFLSRQLGHVSLLHLLPRLNGAYAIIVQAEGTTALAVDRLRSLPLFYAQNGLDIIVSDSASLIYEMLPVAEIDRLSLEEFRTTLLFVTGADTLFSQIKQVQASECVFVESETNRIVAEPYFAHAHGGFEDLAHLRSGFHRSYRIVGENLVRALRGRTAVVPLSGGADSRMVVSLLKQQGYDKVFCFTYGKRDNAESKMSRAVAESLGYPWLMIPYTRRTWHDLNSMGEYRAYLRWAGNFASVPHIQDFPAVRALREAAAVPTDSVFVPGHSGDLLAGSHITRDFMGESLSPYAFFAAISDKFYYGKKLSAGLEERVRKSVPVSAGHTAEELASCCEWFNIRERQAKFIVNSVRVYEFFGYEWLLPLWDNELFDFWRRVPISLRYKRNLYFTCVPNGDLKSTNDVTISSRLGDAVRRTVILRKIVRRVSKIPKYFSSSLQTGGLYGLREYTLGCLLGDEHFSGNNLASERYLRTLIEKKPVHSNLHTMRM